MTANFPGDLCDGNRCRVFTCPLSLGEPRVRSAHAERAVEHFRSQPGLPAINVQLDLEKAYTEPGRDTNDVCAIWCSGRRMPLGKYMNYEAAAELVKTVEVGVRQLCDWLALGCGKAATPLEVKVMKR
jgi:hypothetical protein